MKVIDLLTKIANGEEVPKKIRWNDVIFNYVEEKNYEDYINSNCCSLFEHLGGKNKKYKVTNMLNDEVEIIEDKKIEKFTEYELKHNMVNEYILGIKINELIDKINNMENK